MHVRRSLLLCLSIWLSAHAQFTPDQLGPNEGAVRELGETLLKVTPTEGERLLKDAVAQQASRDRVAESTARITLNRKLAAHAIEQRQWAVAAGYYNAALELANLSQETEMIIQLALARARVRMQTGDRAGALEDVSLAWDLARRTKRSAAQIAAGFEMVEMWRVFGRPREAEPYFEEMLTLPGAPRLELELRRATGTNEADLGLSQRRWREVADLARTAGDLSTQARALDRLGQLASGQKEWGAAVALFEEADALGAPRLRAPLAWFDYSQALTALEHPAAARAAIDRALRETDPKTEPKIVADFEDARAALLARFGEPVAAYEALRRAQTLRTQAPTTALRMNFARQVPATPAADTQQAAALAAVRNDLREAELARTKTQHRATLGIAISGILAAAALSLAYFYKRRAAHALALAKDAAELRAERTHWQMLRYQLNPHFLYNALASLSGLIVTEPVAARRTVGRLSDFCRLALQRSTGDLRCVEEEIQLLEAFLDVEQAGAGDRLRVRFEVDPATRHGRLPPLLLQPLVENALKYGEPNADDVREILVSARREGDRLELAVANTGQWIEPSAAGVSARPGSGTRLGLANVRERIQRLRADASLEIKSSEGWVRVCVTLPWLKTDTLQENVRRPS